MNLYRNPVKMRWMPAVDIREHLRRVPLAVPVLGEAPVAVDRPGGDGRERTAGRSGTERIDLP